MRELPTCLETHKNECIHPWTEESGWESIDIVGGTQTEHDEAVKKFISEGYHVWIDGFFENTTIPAAYLIRKI